MNRENLKKVIEDIKKYEGYETLTPFKKGKRNTLVSENGELVIINTTQSINQPLEKGNFQEIISDGEIWEYACKLRAGSYWAIVRVGEKLLYYRTDLKIVISNREKDNESKDKDRYLCHLMVSDAINGDKCLRVNGGNNQKVTLFVMTNVDLSGGFTEEVCYVYLMTDDANGTTKIGISNKPEFREKTLLSDKSSIVLKKILRFPNRGEALKKETELHNKYKYCNTRGEWFNLTDKELVDLLNEYDWRKPFSSLA